MKHRKVLILVGMVLLLGVSGKWAEAASVGLTAEKQGWDASVEYSHVFDQEMKEQTSFKSSEIDQSQAVLAKVDYAFNENYSLYGKLGMADLETKLTGVSGADRAPYKLDYGFGFAWGIGGKASYPIGQDGLRAILDLQYLRWESSLDSLTVNGTKPSSVSASDVAVSDLSLSGILAKGWGNFTPYLGVKLSRVIVDYGTVSHAGVTVGSTSFLGFTGDFESDNNIGMITGAEYKVTDNLSLNVEGRFIDETAVTGGLTYRF